MRPVPHVFVSSTFVDLKRHRAAVREIIQKLGAHDISMETLGARDRRPLAECLRLVKEESDIFVGIYAHRYGFVPEHSSLSITEAEYDAAVEAGIPCFVFLTAAKRARSAVEDSDGGHVKLERFKATLAASRIVERFSSPKDLAAKVAATLGRHLRQQRLDDSFARQTSVEYTRDRSTSEIQRFLSGLVDDIGYWLQQTQVFRFIDLGSEQLNYFQTAVRTSLPPAFFTTAPGRVAVPQKFQTLDRAFVHARHRLLLTGSPGSGKTTALLTFARAAAERRIADSAAPVPLVVRASTWTSKHTAVTQWLAEQIPALTFSAIEELVESGQALLMIDGLDEVRWRRPQSVDSPPPPDPRRSLLAAIPRVGGVVITCRDYDLETLVSGGVAIPVTAAVSLQSISDTDRLEMLRTRPQLADLATRDGEFGRLTRNPLMLALLLLAYDESSGRTEQLAGLEPSAVRDNLMGHFIENRLQHESMKYGGLEFTLDDVYRCWGPVAMADAGGGGNVNDFDRFEVACALPVGDSQKNRFLTLSHALGLIYSPRTSRLAFTHLLFRDHFAVRQALNALRVGDDSERDSAAWALWQIPDKRAVPLLVNTLTDPYEYARGSAAGALGAIGDPDAVEPLTKLLTDTTPVHSVYGSTIAAVAAWAIARIRSHQMS